MALAPSYKQTPDDLERMIDEVFSKPAQTYFNMHGDTQPDYGFARPPVILTYEDPTAAAYQEVYGAAQPTQPTQPPAMVSPRHRLEGPNDVPSSGNRISPVSDQPQVAPTWAPTRPEYLTAPGYETYAPTRAYGYSPAGGDWSGGYGSGGGGGGGGGGGLTSGDFGGGTDTSTLGGALSALSLLGGANSLSSFLTGKSLMEHAGIPNPFSNFLGGEGLNLQALNPYSNTPLTGLFGEAGRNLGLASSAFPDALAGGVGGSVGIGPSGYLSPDALAGNFVSNAVAPGSPSLLTGAMPPANVGLPASADIGALFDLGVQPELFPGEVMGLDPIGSSGYISLDNLAGVPHSGSSPALQPTTLADVADALAAENMQANMLTHRPSGWLTNRPVVPDTLTDAQLASAGLQRAPGDQAVNTILPRPEGFTNMAPGDFWGDSAASQAFRDANNIYPSYGVSTELGTAALTDAQNAAFVNAIGGTGPGALGAFAAAPGANVMGAAGGVAPALGGPGAASGLNAGFMAPLGLAMYGMSRMAEDPTADPRMANDLENHFQRALQGPKQEALELENLKQQVFENPASIGVMKAAAEGGVPGATHRSGSADIVGWKEPVAAKFYELLPELEAVKVESELANYGGMYNIGEQGLMGKAPNPYGENKKEPELNFDPDTATWQPKRRPAPEGFQDHP